MLTAGLLVLMQGTAERGAASVRPICYGHTVLGQDAPSGQRGSFRSACRGMPAAGGHAVLIVMPCLR